jgi:hypothetical protein
MSVTFATFEPVIDLLDESIYKTKDCMQQIWIQAFLGN